MSTPTAAVKSSDPSLQPGLEEELGQAEEDFARGDFVDVTLDELDRCVAAGEWPWRHASSE
jgi:hypothetical protein